MATRKQYTDFIERAVMMSDNELRQEIDKIKARLGITAHFIDLGMMIKRCEFWTKHRHYEFSFQFWENTNNVYINKDDVEIKSFGGHESIESLLEKTLEWCEKANPKLKYPDNL